MTFEFVKARDGGAFSVDVPLEDGKEGRVKSWEDAEFSGGAAFDNDDIVCTFFPSDSAKDFIQNAVIASSKMVILEQAISYVLNDDGLAEKLAEIRCSQMKILNSVIVPGNASQSCILETTKPGFKWIPKPEQG